jgi:serine/threonine kinase PknH
MRRPDQLDGQVACGSYHGNPNLTWTKDADLPLVDAPVTPSPTFL